MTSPRPKPRWLSGPVGSEMRSAGFGVWAWAGHGQDRAGEGEAWLPTDLTGTTIFRYFTIRTCKSQPRIKYLWKQVTVLLAQCYPVCLAGLVWPPAGSISPWISSIPN